MRILKEIIPSVLASALLAMLAGCATEAFDPDKAPEFIITADFAPFYRLGPQQERGPDASLKTGERVKMLRREFGYSFVQLEDGRSGYIANEEVELAREPAPTEAPRAARKHSARISDSRFEEASLLGSMPEAYGLPEPVDVLHPVPESEVLLEEKPQFRY